MTPHIELFFVKFQEEYECRVLDVFFQSFWVNPSES